jgi:uncharacterized protein YjbI with pentapeptide repeats
MKLKLLSTLTLLTPLIAFPAQAENLQQVQQLVSTRQCQGCELSRAGLVYANLQGADLSGANLVQANLTHANLSGANLQGANLAGAVLYGANLNGADLRGANLGGVDMRDSYVQGINLDGANLQGAVLMGAIGIPPEYITAEDYYRWGLAEDQQGNFSGAIAYYNQAIGLKADFAHAFLARAASRLRLRDMNGALADAQQAEQFYLAQGNEQGHQTSMRFSQGVQAAQEAANERPRRGGGGNFLGFLGGLASLAVRFLLPFR